MYIYFEISLFQACSQCLMYWYTVSVCLSMPSLKCFSALSCCNWIFGFTRNSKNMKWGLSLGQNIVSAVFKDHVCFPQAWGGWGYFNHL